LSRNRVPKKIRQQVGYGDDKPVARKFWRKYLSWTLSIQLVLMNALVFLLGLDYLQLDTTVVSIFVGGVFAEVAGFVYIALRYDFSD